MRAQIFRKAGLFCNAEALLLLYSFLGRAIFAKEVAITERTYLHAAFLPNLRSICGSAEHSDKLLQEAERTCTTATSTCSIRIRKGANDKFSGGYVERLNVGSY